jgi:hypothetical protein
MTRRRIIGPLPDRVSSLIRRRKARIEKHRSTKDIDATLVPLRCQQIKRELREERQNGK